MKFLAFFAAAALLTAGPACAQEKAGMPDLAQIDQTCLPTSTANLMLWFGKHGYPKLILSGASEDERADHTIHMLMADTGARYDLGTEMDEVTHGIESYIHRAGYNCEVEYRGIDGHGSSFSQQWLTQNQDPNTGFILLLTYCHYDERNDSFSDAWNAGHAVTLVNSQPDFLLIHDPAHQSDETGRKIITPRVLTSGSFMDDGRPVPVNGLMMLSGSLLEAPPESGVMLSGAVCITLRKEGPPSAAPASGPNAVLAGTATGKPLPSGASGASQPGWWSWVMSLVLGK